MQACEYDYEPKTLITLRDECVPCNREETERRVTFLREKYGFTDFAGDNVEYPASGCITFPILGTRANLTGKLAFDPGVGGNDESVFHSDFRFLTIDDYRTFPQTVAPLLK